MKKLLSLTGAARKNLISRSHTHRRAVLTSAGLNGRGSNGLIEPLESRQLMSGSGLAAAYYARTNLTLAKYSQVDAGVNFAWNGGTPASVLGTDGFSVRWDGSVLAKFTEKYTFVVGSAGGARLWVNNTLVIDDFDNHAARSASGSIALAANGKYSIRLDYWSDGNEPMVDLEWRSARTPQASIPANRLYPSALDTNVPSQPGGLRATFSGDTSAKINWNASTDPSGVIGYDVYVGSTKVATTLYNQLYYTRSNLTPGTSYSFSVQAVDAAGNLSKTAATAVVTTGNVPAPDAPSDLSVTGKTASSISLSWQAPSAFGSGSTFRIYRDGAKLGVVVTGTSFADVGLSASSSHTYQVRAVDSAGTASGYSNSATGVTSSSGTTVSHDAFSSITAANFDGQSGVSTSGSDVTNTDDGDWVLYKNVNFGGAGAKSVIFQLALSAANRGGSIELHLDSSDGTKIGSLVAQPSGSFSTYQNEVMNIASTTGTHDLYLVFKNRSGVADLRSVTFSTTHLTQIMALGDSITQGSGNAVPWEYYLDQLVRNAGKSVDFVGSNISPYEGEYSQFDYDQNDEGHAGKRADEIADSVTGWATANVPDIVLLHIGTNDLRQGQSVSSTLSDIGRIIDNLRSVNPNVKILLAQIIPTQDYDSQVDSLNSGIASLASSKNSGSSPITLVDQHSGFSESQLYDGIHPDSSGNQHIANTWWSALQGLI